MQTTEDDKVDESKEKVNFELGVDGSSSENASPAHSGQSNDVGEVEKLNRLSTAVSIADPPVIVVDEVDTEERHSNDTYSFKSDLDAVDYDKLSQYSLEMPHNFTYFFQHPYARLFVAYFVVFCNFLIYAEDPVAHSIKECKIPVIGHAFAFVCTRYPKNAWALLKVVLWLTAIIIGLILGKLIHTYFFCRLLKLKMFSDNQGSWMTMFFTCIMSLFIFSQIYNLLLLIGGLSTEKYRISSLTGISNSWFMKAAATGTWLGDFFTAWMVTDMMLQEKLYPGWAVPIRRFWKNGYARIILFWSVVLVLTVIVVTVICTDWISWDKLNHGFLPTNELSRAFLASFILVFDLLIVMQDWDFPHFINSFNVKLPGLNITSFKFEVPVPKFVTKDWWEVHITGKWFNYGIIFMVMLLDLNMWKNQIFYRPYEFGQYTNETLEIYTVQDKISVESFNKTELSFEYRSTHINNATGRLYIEDDTWMYSRFRNHHLAVKMLAFLPSMTGFVIFVVFIAIYGRFKVKENNPYLGRMKKKRTVSNIALAGISRSNTRDNLNTIGQLEGGGGGAASSSVALSETNSPPKVSINAAATAAQASASASASVSASPSASASASANSAEGEERCSISINKVSPIKSESKIEKPSPSSDSPVKLVSVRPLENESDSQGPDVRNLPA